MRVKLYLLPFACIYLMLVSATTIKVRPKADTSISTQQSFLSSNILKHKKANFFERWMFKTFLKKYNKVDAEKADGQAHSSLVWGIVAASTVVLGLFIPYLILASIPAAIVAMVTGGSAIRNETKFVGQARTGKALGLASLISFGVILILAVIIVAAFLSNWN